MVEGFVIHGGASGSIRRRIGFSCGAGLMLLIALTLLVMPLRQSCMALCNRLFDASEQANRYVYRHFDVTAGPGAAQGLLLICMGLYAMLAMAVRGSMLLWLAGIAAAAGQAYFGVALPDWGNMAFYGALGLLLCTKLAGRRALLPCCMLLTAVYLLIPALLPGTSPAVEAASETVRDFLSVGTEEQPAADGAGQSVTRTRHENLRRLEVGSQGAQPDQPYRLVTVAEKQLALPQWVDWLRIILLCLMIPVVLAVPFLPFVWLNKRAERSRAKRARLADTDCDQVILCAFALVTGYLDACAIGDPDALYTCRINPTSELFPAGYAQLYKNGARIWQEAAYSDHPMTTVQRDTVLSLLEQTESWLYDRADWKTRARLKYFACLHD